MAIGQNQTPRQRIAAECARRGRNALVAGCVELLRGRYDEVDDDLVIVLGGEHAVNVLGGSDGGKAGYWPRVWAARGLLHAWDDTARDDTASDHAAWDGTARDGTASAGAVSDETTWDSTVWDSVVGAAATGAIIGATSDDAWRVREMAAKVVARHRIGEALAVVAALRDDPVDRVRAAAERAVTALTASAA